MCLLDLLQGKGEKWDAVEMSCTLFCITVRACKCDVVTIKRRDALCTYIYIYRERETETETETETEREHDEEVLCIKCLLQSLFWSLVSGTEIQCRFDDSEICLNFRKRVGPLRDWREPIFVTIFLPEFISDQAVRPASSNFVEVVSVFKGSHRFNRDVRNGKKVC